MDRCRENVIEFLEDEQRATVTFSQTRFKNRIKKLAVERVGECQIVAQNKDGSICAHIPVRWIRINPQRHLTEEQKEKREKALRKNLSTNINNNRREK